MVITIVTTVIITHMYGREGYGAFSLMQNYPALLFIIADFGLNAIAVRELAQDFTKAASYFGNILVMRIILSVILMLSLGLAVCFLPYDQVLKWGIYLNLFLILTQALYATTNVIFQSRLRYDLSVIGYVSGYVVILALVVLLSYVKASVMWVSFSYVLGGLVTFLVNVRLFRKLGVVVRWSIDWHLIKHLFLQSLPLGLMFIFSQINFKADSIALSVLKVPVKYGLNNTETVAVYGLPYKVFEVTLVVPTFFMNAAYPVLVKHMHEGRKKLKSTLTKVLGFLFAGSIVAGVLGVAFAPFVIDVLGGAEFLQSVVVLRILLSGLVIFYLTQPISWLVVTLGKQVYLPWIYLVSAVFDVSANIIFIPKYSFYGSSVITIISEALVLIMLVYAARRAWKHHYAS